MVFVDWNLGQGVKWRCGWFRTLLSQYLGWLLTVQEDRLLFDAGVLVELLNGNVFAQDLVDKRAELDQHYGIGERVCRNFHGDLSSLEA